MSTAQNRYWLECQHMRSIFPDNVWTIILDDLEDSPDALESLSNSSLYFRQRLLPKRKLFLAGKVLDEVAGWIKPNLGEGLYYWNDVKKFQLTNLLNCRLVCSSWCNALDQLFLENKSLFTKQLSNGGLFSDWSSVNKFLEHFQNTHSTSTIIAQRCPHVIKSVRIKIKYHDVLNGLPIFLRNYGAHILKLSVLIKQDTFPSQLSSYQMLVNVLSAMGRLTHLKIAYRQEQDDSRLTSTDELIGPPVPTLKYLKEFEASGLPTVVFNRILHSNLFVQKLKLNYRDVDELTFSKSFPNLTEMCLYNPVSNFKTLAGTVSDCYINRLSLTFCDDEKGKYNRLFKMFDIIPPYWSSTVNELTVQFPRYSRKFFDEQIFLDSIRCRVNLPHVRKLEIYLGHAVGFNFLLSMANSLEKLKISMSSNYEYMNEDVMRKLESEEVIQGLGFTDRMYESNIWKHFVNLRVIDFGRYGVFYRREWRKNQLNMSLK